MLLETDQRYTPESVLAVVRSLGPIGLDPCAPDTNPVSAWRFYTADDDGLALSWQTGPGSLVYVNPPYSRGELARWSQKAVAAFLEGSEVLLLTPCDLGTRWASVLFGHAVGLAGWRGRIAFVRPDGTYETGAKQPSVFWYLGARFGAFHASFSGHANVTRLGV